MSQLQFNILIIALTIWVRSAELVFPFSSCKKDEKLRHMSKLKEMLFPPVSPILKIKQKEMCPFVKSYFTPGKPNINGSLLKSSRNYAVL